MWYVAVLFVGIVIGIVLHRIYEYVLMKADGYIILNKSDPDFATAGIDFYNGAADISKKRRIILEVIPSK